MYRLPRNYHQIYRVDHKRDQEQMVARDPGRFMSRGLDMDRFK